MQTRYKILTLLACVLMSVGAQAQDNGVGSPDGAQPQNNNARGYQLIARAGYVIGGTTPLPLPAEIRSIDGFSPRGGFSLGIDARKMWNEHWGTNLGLHFFSEGFDTQAEVKNYRMELTQEGNTMSGYFTGENDTHTDMWGITIPMTATYQASKHWSVSAGPYVSFYFNRNFNGKVYDNKHGVGYLRVDTPTGDKVEIDRTNPATYDFAAHTMWWNCGMELVLDWQGNSHWGAFGKVDWGLSNIMENDFAAVAFRMYPIYATLGVSYKL